MVEDYFYTMKLQCRKLEDIYFKSIIIWSYIISSNSMVSWEYSLVRDWKGHQFKSPKLEQLPYFCYLAPRVYNVSFSRFTACQLSSMKQGRKKEEIKERKGKQGNMKRQV